MLFPAVQSVHTNNSSRQNSKNHCHIRHLKKVEDFLRTLPPEELKAECLLPNMVGDLLKKGQLSVSVLHSADRWFGMTYHEDRQAVAQELARLHENGTYPATLRN